MLKHSTLELFSLVKVRLLYKNTRRCEDVMKVCCQDFKVWFKASVSGFIDNFDVYDIVKRCWVYIYAGLVMTRGMMFYHLLKKQSVCYQFRKKKIVMK